MATWPATLPTFQQFLKDSYQESAPDNVIRTEMEVGPAKVRQRSTAAPTPISGSMYMTTAQVATFRTFFDSTIDYGEDEFDTVHPRTGASVSVSFVGAPQLSKMGIGWQLTFAAEILP